MFIKEYDDISVIRSFADKCIIRRLYVNNFAIYAFQRYYKYTYFSIHMIYDC